MGNILKFLPWDASLTINTFDLMRALESSNLVKIVIITLLIFCVSFLVINSVSVTPNSKKDARKQRRYWWFFLGLLLAAVSAWNYWVYASFFLDPTFASMFVSHFWFSTFISLASFIVLTYLFKLLFPYWRYGELNLFKT